MPKPKKPQTTWKLPKGYTITICGNVLQVCDAADDELLCIEQDDAGAWLEALTDASHTQNGY